MMHWTAHNGPIRALGYSPDGAWLVSGGDDPSLGVWDPVSGQRRADVRHQFPTIEDLAFSPDGRFLALATLRPVLVVCDCADLRRDGPLAGVGSQPERSWEPLVSSVAFSPDGQYLVSAGALPRPRSEAILWNATVFNLGRIRDLPVPRIDSLTIKDTDCLTAAYASDGRTIALGGFQGLIVLWLYPNPRESLQKREKRFDSAARGRQVHRSCFVEVRAGSGDPVRRIAFSPDNTTLAAAIGNVVDLWDYRHPEERLPVVSNRRQLRGHADCVRSLAFTPDGRTIATASLDGTLRLWDARETFEFSCLDAGAGPLHCLALAPDGMTVAVGGEQGDIAIIDVDERL